MFPTNSCQGNVSLYVAVLMLKTWLCHHFFFSYHRNQSWAECWGPTLLIDPTRCTGTPYVQNIIVLSYIDKG